jgi:cytidylate kinase
MFRIIAVEREFGCGGAPISAEIARRLDWKLWDHDLTEEIAKLAHVDCRTVEQQGEKLDGTFYRLAKVFWRGSYERSLPLPDTEAFDADCMMSMMERIAARIADEGNAVVVGRGSPYYFRGRSDTFSVFLYAPRQEKIRRLVESGRQLAEAEELVDTIDRERKTFIKHYFNSEWPTRSLYHLMVNTAMGDERVIQTVLDTLHRIQGSPALTGFEVR